MKLALAIALSIAIVGGANADDTYVSRVGGAAKMIKGHPTIRMVREHVRIEPVSGKVVATFVFRNEGPKQTVLIGFPETEYHGSKPYERFWSTVDGNPIGVTPVKGRFEEDTKGRYWTKRVAFDKGQTREVMVGYLGGKGEVSDGQQLMCYVLKSGAAWKGSIGQVRIDCDLTRLKHADKVEYSMEPDKISKAKASWLIKNWEPDENLRISWYPGFVSFKSNSRQILDRLFHCGYDTKVKTPFRLTGDDVLVPARSLASLVRAKIIKSQGRLSLDSGTVKATYILGSNRIWTAKGLQKTALPIQTMNGCTYVPLARSLKLFGAEAHYDRRAKAMCIAFPSAWK